MYDLLDELYSVLDEGCVISETSRLVEVEDWVLFTDSVVLLCAPALVVVPVLLYSDPAG